MPKGSSYEREISTLLSLWWSNQKYDDIFWRTAGSGGRATSRRSRGKSYRGREGDIGADDPSGRPMTRVFHIELKRGYNRETLNEITDHGGMTKPADASLEKWIYKISKRGDRTPFWILIHKRDRRTAMIFFPHKLLEERILRDVIFKRPFVIARVRIRKNRKDKGKAMTLCQTTLNNFLRAISPKQIKIISRQYRSL